MRQSAAEQEQIEIIKQWWHQYGKYLAFAVVFGLIIGFAWKSWHQHQLNASLQASQLYQQLLVAESKSDLSTTTSTTKILLSRYASSPYAVMASFVMAKQAVQNQHFAQAISALQWILTYGQEASFRQIARLRLARILLSQHQWQNALQTLDKVEDDTFNPMINAVRGDIYWSMGDHVKAKQAYTLAQKQFNADSADDSVLQLKLTQPDPSIQSTSANKSISSTPATLPMHSQQNAVITPVKT